MRILVLGAGGFIGSHMINKLKLEGHWVCGVDLKLPEFFISKADVFIQADLTDFNSFGQIPQHSYDEVYQFAANMGGAEYVFVKKYDHQILLDNTQINTNTLRYCVNTNAKKIFFPSSACVYPSYNQLDPMSPNCKENSVYPANPDSEYGWEKLFSERMYLAYNKNTNLQVRIARYHNIYGPYGPWHGGREKAPAALCRKVAVSKPGEPIEIFGSGLQTRSFLYIDDCIDRTISLMRSKVDQPLNIGSSLLISMSELTQLILKIANKTRELKYIPGPTGVMGRCSDNYLGNSLIGWRPEIPLEVGLEKTYNWILSQIETL